jgi:hypothetical protein
VSCLFWNPKNSPKKTKLQPNFRPEPT